MIRTAFGTISGAGGALAARRAAGAAVIVTGVAMAVAACTGSGGHGHPAAARTPGSATSAAGPSSAAPAQAGRFLDGRELARLLPPSTPLPHGWSVSTGTATYERTVAFQGKPFAALGQIPPSFDACDNWNDGFNPSDLLSLWQMAYANAEVAPPRLPHALVPGAVTLRIASFLPGDAAKQLAWDAAFARRCPRYRSNTDGTVITVRAAPVRGLGYQSLYVRLRNTYRLGGGRIHEHASVLLLQAGNNVVGVGQDGDATDPREDPVVPFTDLKRIALWIARSLRPA